jgi:hypothetical protein
MIGGGVTSSAFKKIAGLPMYKLPAAVCLSVKFSD